MLWIQKPNFCSILSKPASSVSIIQLIPYPEGGKGVIDILDVYIHYFKEGSG